MVFTAFRVLKSTECHTGIYKSVLNFLGKLHFILKWEKHQKQAQVRVRHDKIEKSYGSKDKIKEARWRDSSLDSNKKKRATDLTGHVLEYWNIKFISDLKKHAQKHNILFPLW